MNGPEPHNLPKSNNFEIIRNHTQCEKQIKICDNYLQKQLKIRKCTCHLHNSKTDYSVCMRTHHDCSYLLVCADWVWMSMQLAAVTGIPHPEQYACMHSSTTLHRCNRHIGYNNNNKHMCRDNVYNTPNYECTYIRLIYTNRRDLGNAKNPGPPNNSKHNDHGHRIRKKSKPQVTKYSNTIQNDHNNFNHTHTQPQNEDTIDRGLGAAFCSDSIPLRNDNYNKKRKFEANNKHDAEQGSQNNGVPTKIKSNLSLQFGNKCENNKSQMHSLVPAVPPEGSTNNPVRLHTPHAGQVPKEGMVGNLIDFFNNFPVISKFTQKQKKTPTTKTKTGSPTHAPLNLRRDSTLTTPKMTMILATNYNSTTRTTVTGLTLAFTLKPVKTHIFTMERGNEKRQRTSG